MLLPDTVRDLPAGSVVISSTWAALRLPTEPERYRFWQVTGRVARLSDPEMVRMVARAQAEDDPLIRVVRIGSQYPGATADDLYEMAVEVSDVLDEMTTRATFGMTPAAAGGLNESLRRRFAARHPRLAALLERT